MRAIKVELGSGQQIAVTPFGISKALRMIQNEDWLIFEPILAEDTPENFKPEPLYIRTTFVVALWPVDEEPVYRVGLFEKCGQLKETRES